VDMVYRQIRNVVNAWLRIDGEVAKTITIK
jgi:hypothetical protein